MSTIFDKRFSEKWSTFLRYKENRNQHVRFFNKNGISRNIIDYVRDSNDRMNEYHLKAEWKDDWQSNLFDPVTRNKIITILSKLSASRMSIEVFVKARSIFQNSDTKTRAQIYKDLLDLANEHNREDEQLIYEMYTGMSEGTVIGQEGFMKDKRKAKFVKQFNPDTGEIETEDVEYDAWDDVYGEIVPIEEFYPETIWVNPRDFKIKVKRCFRVQELKFDTFKDKFGRYPNADKVKPAGYWFSQEGFEWGIETDVLPDNVQVIEWFNEANDEHGIWANGEELYWGPIEFNHKRKPFWIAISEPIHHQFLYGKSFPDKLMAMQDMNNALFNAILDQLHMALNSPIFVNGDIEDLDNDYIEPSRIYKMDPDTTIQRGGLSSVDQTSFQVLQLIKRSMEESSISSEAQGVATGGRKTKYEVQLLQENSLNLAGLFLQLMESAMRDKYSLRLSNIIQYYSQPSEAMDGSVRFKYLVLDNRRLPNGKMGKKMIQIIPTLGDRTPGQMNQELIKAAEAETGEEFNPATSKVQPIVITADYLLNKDIETDIRIVPNSSVKESSVQKKNADITFYNLTSNNPMVDQVKNLQDLASAFGKDQDIVKENTEQNQDPLMAAMEKVQQSPNIDNVNLDLI